MNNKRRWRFNQQSSSSSGGGQLVTTRLSKVSLRVEMVLLLLLYFLLPSGSQWRAGYQKRHIVTGKSLGRGWSSMMFPAETLKAQTLPNRSRIHNNLQLGSPLINHSLSTILNTRWRPLESQTVTCPIRFISYLHFSLISTFSRKYLLSFFRVFCCRHHLPLFNLFSFVISVFLWWRERLGVCSYLHKTSCYRVCSYACL